VGSCNILPFKKPKLWTYFLLKTVAHNVQSWKKIGICFGLLSHYSGLTQNIKKMLYTAIGARSPPLYVIIHYKYI